MRLRHCSLTPDVFALVRVGASRELAIGRHRVKLRAFVGFGQQLRCAEEEQMVNATAPQQSLNSRSPALTRRVLSPGIMRLLGWDEMARSGELTRSLVTAEASDFGNKIGTYCDNDVILPPHLRGHAVRQLLIEVHFWTMQVIWSLFPRAIRTPWVLAPPSHTSPCLTLSLFL